MCSAFSDKVKKFLPYWLINFRYSNYDNIISFSAPREIAYQSFTPMEQVKTKNLKRRATSIDPEPCMRRSNTPGASYHRATTHPPVTAHDDSVRITSYDDAVSLLGSRDSEKAENVNANKHSAPLKYICAVSRKQSQTDPHHPATPVTGYDSAYVSYRNNSEMIQRQAGSHASVKVHEILRNLHIDDGDSNITKDKDGHRISSKDSHYMKSKDSHHLIKSKDSYSHIKPKTSHHVKSKDSHQHIKSKDSLSNVKLKRQESSSYFQKSDSLSLFWTQGSQSTFQMLHNDKQNESHLKVRNKESHHRSGVGRQRGASWLKLRQKESVIHQFHASTKLG